MCRNNSITAGTPRNPRTAQSQVCYKINIRTGSTPDSGTSSRTYITLEGSKGQIKRHRLSRGGRESSCSYLGAWKGSKFEEKISEMLTESNVSFVCTCIFNN